MKKYIVSILIMAITIMTFQVNIAYAAEDSLIACLSSDAYVINGYSNYVAYYWDYSEDYSYYYFATSNTQIYVESDGTTDDTDVYMMRIKYDKETLLYSMISKTQSYGDNIFDEINTNPVTYLGRSCDVVYEDTGYDALDEDGNIRNNEPIPIPRSHEVVEAVGQIEVHHQGFAQDDTLEITFTKYDFPNVDWGESETYTEWIKSTDATVIFEFGEKYKPFFSMTDYYGVTVTAYKDGECTYYETTVGDYGNGARYHALPYDTSEYIGDVPNPRSFIGTSMQIEGTLWTLLEWYMPNPSNWNIELQVKTENDNWQNLSGTPLTNGEQDYMTNYTEFATHYRIRAQDNTDTRRYSDWVVLDASLIDEEQNPNEVNFDDVQDFSEYSVGSKPELPETPDAFDYIVYVIQGIIWLTAYAVKGIGMLIGLVGQVPELVGKMFTGLPTEISVSITIGFIIAIVATIMKIARG